MIVVGWMLLAGGGAFDDLPKGVGHCAEAERTFFSCPVKGGKIVSLCGNDAVSSLQYRFGKAGAIELAFPEDSAVKAFRHEYTAWARGEENAVLFDNGVFTYKLVYASGSGIDGASNNYAGVKVLKGDEEMAFLQCSKWPQDGLTPLAKHLKPPD